MDKKVFHNPIFINFYDKDNLFIYLLAILADHSVGERQGISLKNSLQNSLPQDVFMPSSLDGFQWESHPSTIFSSKKGRE